MCNMQGNHAGSTQLTGPAMPADSKQRLLPFLYRNENETVNIRVRVEWITRLSETFSACGD